MKLIVAMARNRVIGREGKLPWHLPEDLKWFKETTMGGIVLMGRKTFDSVGRPLPGRLNLILSRKGIEGFPFNQEVAVQTKTPGTSIRVISSVDDFNAEEFSGREIFVIGGAEIYRHLLPKCSEIFLTYVNQDVEGDAKFPEFEGEFALKEIVRSTPEFEIRRYLRK